MIYEHPLAAEVTKVFFDLEFWSLSPNWLQEKALTALSLRSQVDDLDGRTIASIMCAIKDSPSSEIRRLACNLFVAIISSRNSGVSFPSYWLRSLHSQELKTLLDFQHETLPRHQQSAISKYPSYPFEVEDMEAFYRSYMQQPRPAGMISKRHRISTLGSCFAINVANYLSRAGFNARAFELGELVNNTYTNLFILQNDISADEDWVKLQPVMADGIRRFKKELKSADVVILTLGLGLAFYRDSDGEPLINPLYSFRKDHYSGYSMKPIPLEDNLSNFRNILSEIRTYNPQAKIFATLSPVPLDGCKGTIFSAIEADCISKSIGRVTLAQAELEGFDFTYFPSYELVRWVATARPFPPAFGGDPSDCYLRHPTSSVIETVMKCFVSHHCIL